MRQYAGVDDCDDDVGGTGRDIPGLQRIDPGEMICRGGGRVVEIPLRLLVSGSLGSARRVSA